MPKSKYTPTTPRPFKGRMSSDGSITGEVGEPPRSNLPAHIAMFKEGLKRILETDAFPMTNATKLYFYMLLISGRNNQMNFRIKKAAKTLGMTERCIYRALAELKAGKVVIGKPGNYKISAFDAFNGGNELLTSARLEFSELMRAKKELTGQKSIDMSLSNECTNLTVAKTAENL